MTKTSARAIRHAVDPCGLRVVLVPLDAARSVAVVEAEDYHRLISAGLSPNWFLNSNGKGREYVRASDTGVRGKLLMPARLILGAGANRVVRFLDGDPTNLRRSNLALRVGRAVRSDADVLGRARDARKAADEFVDPCTAARSSLSAFPWAQKAKEDGHCASAP